MYLTDNNDLFVDFKHVNKMCINKKRYSERKNARRAVKRMKQDDGKKRYVYKCPVCGFYHITSHAKKEYRYVKTAMADRGRKETSKSKKATSNM